MSLCHHRQLLSISHVSFIMALFLFLAMPLMDDAVLAETDSKYRIAILPPDLHDQAHVHTTFINKAVSDSLSGNFEIQSLLSLYETYIQVGGERFSLENKKLWYRKSMLTLKYQPKIDYVQQIGKKLNVDAIIMYSIHVGTNAPDYIHTYLIDIATGQEYYQTETTQVFDGINSGKQEGYGAIVNTTRKVISDQQRRNKAS